MSDSRSNLNTTQPIDRLHLAITLTLPKYEGEALTYLNNLSLALDQLKSTDPILKAPEAKLLDTITSSMINGCADTATMFSTQDLWLKLRDELLTSASRFNTLTAAELIANGHDNTIAVHRLTLANNNLPTLAATSLHWRSLSLWTPLSQTTSKISETKADTVIYSRFESQSTQTTDSDDDTHTVVSPTGYLDSSDDEEKTETAQLQRPFINPFSLR